MGAQLAGAEVDRPVRRVEQVRVGVDCSGRTTSRGRLRASRASRRCHVRSRCASRAGRARGQVVLVAELGARLPRPRTHRLGDRAGGPDGGAVAVVTPARPVPGVRTPRRSRSEAGAPRGRRAGARCRRRRAASGRRQRRGPALAGLPGSCSCFAIHSLTRTALPPRLRRDARHGHGGTSRDRATARRGARVAGLRVELADQHRPAVQDRLAHIDVEREHYSGPKATALAALTLRAQLVDQLVDPVPRLGPHRAVRSHGRAPAWSARSGSSSAGRGRPGGPCAARRTVRRTRRREAPRSWTRRAGIERGRLTARWSAVLIRRSSWRPRIVAAARSTQASAPPLRVATVTAANPCRDCLGGGVLAPLLLNLGRRRRADARQIVHTNVAARRRKAARRRLRRSSRSR